LGKLPKIGHTTVSPFVDIARERQREESVK
jgi:hypothetical protein